MMQLHRAHSQKLRRGRFSEPNRIYFVTSSCEGRARIFEHSEYAQLLLSQFRREEHRGDCRSLVAMVMPDHIHWLVQILSGRTVQEIVGSLKGCAAIGINRLRNKSGRIWQAGFYDHAVRQEESLEDIAKYMLDNPVRAGLVSDYRNYPHWESVWHSHTTL